jgi:predicted small secreted protein
MRRNRVVGAVAAFALGATALTGCSNLIEGAIGNIVEGGIDKIIGDEAGFNIDVDGDGITINTEDGKVNIGSGSSLPADFPSSVPLPKTGKLTATVEVSTGWALHFEGVSEADLLTYMSEVERQGFTRQPGSSGTTGVFEGHDITVVVSWLGEGAPISLHVTKPR